MISTIDVHKETMMSTTPIQSAWSRQILTVSLVLQEELRSGKCAKNCVVVLEVDLWSFHSESGRKASERGTLEYVSDTKALKALVAGEEMRLSAARKEVESRAVVLSAAKGNARWLLTLIRPDTNPASDPVTGRLVRESNLSDRCEVSLDDPVLTDSGELVLEESAVTGSCGKGCILVMYTAVTQLRETCGGKANAPAAVESVSDAQGLKALFAAESGRQAVERECLAREFVLLEASSEHAKWRMALDL